ncbi:MAG TPA: tol-pal system protein YbgF [Polyangia bacterium]
MAVGFVVALAGGCADRSAPLRREISDLRRKLEAAAHEKTEQRGKIDELTNQILILQDKLERAATTAARPVAPPRPQVIRVKPAAPAEPEPHPVALEDGDIEYAGEARDTRSPRPVLRIEGPNARRGMTPVGGEVEQPEVRPARAVRTAKRAPLPPPPSGERLPVVPLPDRGVPGAGSAPAAGARPAAGVRPTAPAGSPATAYGRALEALRRKSHAEAINGFRDFLKTWPRHELAQNAQYWLAETYYDLADHKTALDEFRRVVQRHPSGTKAPDALLKAGYCHAKLGDTKNARNLLGQVVELYPKSAAARLASDRLRALR